jgi:hypothetical protein
MLIIKQKFFMNAMATEIQISRTTKNWIIKEITVPTFLRVNLIIQARC